MFFYYQNDEDIMKGILKLLIIPVVLFCEKSFAQLSKFEPFFGEGFSYIEGRIENLPDKEKIQLSFVLEEYVEQRMVSIQVKDGFFSAEIPVTDVCDIFFSCGKGQYIRFFTYKNDTIKMAFDYNNAMETMRLYGNTENRNKELELCLLLSKHAGKNPKFHVTNTMVNPTIHDSVKIKTANDYYDSAMRIIHDFEAVNPGLTFLEKNKIDLYFDVCEAVVFWGTGLLSKIHNESYRINSDQASCFYMDYDIFRLSNNYRNFLGRLLFVQSRPRFTFANIPEEDEMKMPALKKDYFYALSQISCIPIRDWYITNRCELNIPDSEVQDIKYVYDDFKTICKNERYLTKLKRMYDDMERLYNASEAPDFKLKNELGEWVSLSDFQGQIVYIDFWDTYCAPCIDQFKNYDKAFHAKYPDIVHVYVCSSNDEKRWKSDIKKYDLQGINLIVSSQEKEKLFDNYVVKAFPHYVLISSNGKVFKNGCERPSEMLGHEENSITHLLKITE